MDDAPVVVVIGAGIVGCSVAWELARRGASVTLLDRNVPGGGATRAAAGLLAPGFDARATSPFRDVANRSLDLLERFITDVSVASGIAVEFCQCGAVEVAGDGTEWARLRNAACEGAVGLDGDALREKVPALGDGFPGGLFTARNGYVVVEALMSALVRALTSHRGDIVTDCEVRGFAFEGKLVTVESSRGRFGADAVVVAAGADSTRLGLPDDLAPPLRQLSGRVLQLQSVPGGLRHVLLGSQCHLVPWRDGRVLVGARVEEVEAEAGQSVAALRELLQAACRLVPSLSRATFLGTATGVRAEAPDMLPILGPSSRDPRLIYATGYHRSGVLMAPLTAAVVADLVVAGQPLPALDQLAPARLGL